jgi:UDP-3-O-[3-hydroxymyristoyl] N-acetylglucosamine deacetylase
MTKVLIIDDEKSILESLSSVLRDEGFDVRTAKDGREGLALFAEVKPRIVLLDIWMPEMDGLEVLSRVKELDPEAVVVVISGHGTISTAVEAVKMGAVDFLEKPLSIEKVLDVIARGLAGKINGKERNEDDVHIEAATGRTGREQKTIGKSVVAYGVGNHSGVHTGMILLPMPPDTGILFEHMPDGERIPAIVDNVFSQGFASSLKGPRCTIQTVEHLLAACHMYGLTNLLIKVSEEVPIFDGSARDICAKIEEAGIVEQKQEVEPLIIKERISLDNLPRGKSLSIEPAEEFEIDYTLDHPLPTIGRQRYFFTGGKESFLANIAPARTFGSIDDFEKLAKTGVGSGGRISNVMKSVILVDNQKVINTELRFEDEFARHKVLDLMGDMYLIGRPVVGRVVAERTGHMENIALVKEIKRKTTA